MATLGTALDFASLTKLIAATALFLALGATARPPRRRRTLVPGAAVGRAGVTLGDLLAHRAGLPGFVPSSRPILRSTPACSILGCPAARTVAARDRSRERAPWSSPPTAPLRARALYSDVGFLVLGELLAAAAGAPLDGRVRRAGRGAHRRGCPVSSPLVRGSRAHDRDPAAIAPTGRTRPREPAPGQEAVGAVRSSPVAPAGEVDDDNAWVLDGVAGHAGLFGSVGYRNVLPRVGR